MGAGGTSDPLPSGGAIRDGRIREDEEQKKL